MIDAHCHLMHEKFNADRSNVLARAKTKLKAIVETGGNMEQNEAALNFRNQHKKFVYAAIGLAPHFATTTNVPAEFEFIERNAEDAIAMGEIGLEYHYFPDEKDRERQKQVFREQLILAEKLGLPIVTHCREAYPDLFMILQDFPHQKVMLHFFNKPAFMQEALKRGYMLSIATLKSKEIDKIIKNAPLNNLLSETDSPYLWSEGRNEPANVAAAWERISEIKGIPLEEVKSALFANAAKFFEVSF
ncbi:MAG: TatD family hydrolase [Candidatus Micrarchaeota archaeon]